MTGGCSGPNVVVVMSVTSSSRISKVGGSNLFSGVVQKRSSSSSLVGGAEI